MMKTAPPPAASAEIIALKALGFLAEEPDRLQRFMELSGLNPEVIRRDAGEPAFLAGVLDHLLADQTLLLMFTEAAGLTPAEVERGRNRLPGGPA